jgi:hypothetical protein
LLAIEYVCPPAESNVTVAVDAENPGPLNVWDVLGSVVLIVDAAVEEMVV